MMSQKAPILSLKRRVVGITLLLVCLPAVTLASTPENIAGEDFCSLAPLPEKQREQLEQQLEDRGGTPPEDRAAAALVIAGHSIAQASRDERDCRKRFARGQKSFERALKKQTRKVSRNAGAATSDDPGILKVQEQLRDAFIADQAARLAYLDLATEDRTGADYWAQRLATARTIALDARHTRLLESLLADYDWIDQARFGARASNHAWLIAQHADARPAFQQAALERMRPYLASGGVRQRNYAYLYDRVAVNTGRLQRYGTQPRAECNADRSLSPQPLEDPETVDERRAEFGMEPMAEAMAEMASRRCR